MSLDGYIVREDNTIRELVEWLQNGDAELLTVGDRTTFYASLSASPDLVSPTRMLPHDVVGVCL